MIEFSRKHQENKLVATQEAELRKLTEEEIELEEKLQQLFELDRALQEKSVHLANLQEDKELLEKGLKSLLQTIEWEPDPQQQRHLAAKKQSLENELTLLRKRLAAASKVRDIQSLQTVTFIDSISLFILQLSGLGRDDGRKREGRERGDSVAEESVRIEQESESADPGDVIVFTVFFQCWR